MTGVPSVNARVVLKARILNNQQPVSGKYFHDQYSTILLPPPNWAIERLQIQKTARRISVVYENSIKKLVLLNLDEYIDRCGISNRNTSSFS